MSTKNKINSFPLIYFIGAQKAGTTTLYRWLRQDSRLQFPNIKETHFFSTNYHYGKKWYLNRFNKNNNYIRCEVDPSYIFHSKAISRILSLSPCSKFIIILRKPIERSYSHYLMSKYRGYEKLSFVDALINEKKRLSIGDIFSLNNYSYLKRSEYPNQINKLLSMVDKSNILFLNFNDLFIKNRASSLEKIYKFINLEYKNDLNLDIKANKAKSYKNNFIRDLIYSDNFIRGLFKYIIPSYSLRYKIKFFLEKLNSSKIIHDEVSLDNLIDSIPKEYVEWNNEQVYKTQKITNLQLNEWII